MTEKWYEANANYIRDVNYPASLTPIQQFYAGTNIFLTGATGFMGKILMEKLLRSCSELSSIYVLVRQKKGKDMHSRLDELFDDAIFDRLKKEFPKFQHKIVGIAGDCGQPDLGLSAQDKQMLTDEINVVFHAAATVRFDEKLKLAVAINVKGPREILKLCKGMPKLKALMHVSTAYANCPMTNIEEKIYQPAMEHNKLIAIADAANDKMLEVMLPVLLDKWPNTYAFTKQVAEEMIRIESGNLPVGIFRPAIVVSTYKEPIKGWINNLYGPTGVCAGAGTGLLRTLHCDPELTANIVPVDMCVNSLIACAWEVGNEHKKRDASKSKEILVYNYESNSDMPISWSKFMFLSHKYGMQTPSMKAIWYYCFSIHKYLITHMLAIWFLHYVPAAICDVALFCVGKKPRMINIYRKVHKFTAVISYFSTRQWQFANERVRHLCEIMSKEDKEIFFSDMQRLDWNEFFKEYLNGIRVYLLNDPISTQQEARIRFNRLYWLHQATKVVLLFVAVRLALYLFNSIFT